MKGKRLSVIDKFHNQTEMLKKGTFFVVCFGSLCAELALSLSLNLSISLVPSLFHSPALCPSYSLLLRHFIRCSNVHGAWCVYRTTVWQVHYRNVGKKNERVLVL